jgi:hypothetical protein
MFIPDTGSEFFPSRLPDPGSALKNLSIFTQKTVFYTLGNMIRVVLFRIRILIFYPSRIPHPGVKKAPDPGSGSATLIFGK